MNVEKLMKAIQWLPVKMQDRIQTEIRDLFNKTPGNDLVYFDRSLKKFHDTVSRHKQGKKGRNRIE